MCVVSSPGEGRRTHIMGVPSFFRWIHDKFPRCVSAFAERPVTQHLLNNWYREPNPNGIEFDNLYLDFNQIVHNATHPTDRPVPTTRKAAFEEIFRATDRLVCAARPRRMLVLALDGVAPRAKMNQQRARRFLAVTSSENELRQQMATNTSFGEEAPDVHFDHNAITPGSEFMANLGESLRCFCAQRTESSEAWRHLTVVLSDASTPGEGEHKIMDIIRTQRMQPDYNPDSTHLVYGLDADLVSASTLISAAILLTIDTPAVCSSQPDLQPVATRLAARCNPAHAHTELLPIQPPSAHPPPHPPPHPSPSAQPPPSAHPPTHPPPRPHPHPPPQPNLHPPARPHPDHPSAASDHAFTCHA